MRIATLSLASVLALSLATLSLTGPAWATGDPLVPVGFCTEEAEGSCPATVCAGISDQVPTCLDLCTDEAEDPCAGSLCVDSSNTQVGEVCTPPATTDGPDKGKYACTGFTHDWCPGAVCVFVNGNPGCYLGPPLP